MIPRWFWDSASPSSAPFLYHSAAILSDFPTFSPAQYMSPRMRQAFGSPSSAACSIRPTASSTVCPSGISCSMEYPSPSFPSLDPWATAFLRSSYPFSGDRSTPSPSMYMSPSAASARMCPWAADRVCHDAAFSAERPTPSPRSYRRPSANWASASPFSAAMR